MKTMSLNKVGGISLCVGAVLLTIPFILQITFGGTPEEGTLIWRYFSEEILSGGKFEFIIPPIIYFWSFTLYLRSLHS